MGNYTADALGAVIRERRQSLSLSQEELADGAEYGKGGAVSISRIERGLVSPSDSRFAGIALTLGLTPRQLQQEAEERTRLLSSERSHHPQLKLREQVAATKSRHAKVAEKVSERAMLTQELGEAFNRVHDAARDEFFMSFVALAETISGAPEPDRPVEDEVEPSPQVSTAIRVESMSAGIADAIRGAASGGVAGAAVGGAAAYGAFTAAAMFGSASTGVAISTLSGVAASNATMALLGGGTLAAGGAGMAGGALLLTGMVAAPAAALAAAGFLVVKQRRTKKEEERLRAQVEAAEQALQQSQAGFNAMVDILSRATAILEYLSIHGTHALEKWVTTLPAKPRTWEALTLEARERYHAFLVLAGCLLAVSSINIGALLTAETDALREMVSAIEETLAYADGTIRSIV